MYFPLEDQPLVENGHFEDMTVVIFRVKISVCVLVFSTYQDQSLCTHQSSGTQRLMGTFGFSHRKTTYRICLSVGQMWQKRLVWGLGRASVRW